MRCRARIAVCDIPDPPRWAMGLLRSYEVKIYGVSSCKKCEEFLRNSAIPSYSVSVRSSASSASQATQTNQNELNPKDRELARVRFRLLGSLALAGYWQQTSRPRCRHTHSVGLLKLRSCQSKIGPRSEKRSAIHASLPNRPRLASRAQLPSHDRML